MKSILKFILIAGALMLTSQSKVQNIKEHKWNKRVVLLISKTPKSSKLVKQLNLFKNQNLEFNERKLIIYKVLLDSYKLNNPKHKTWTKSKKIFQFYNEEKLDFKIILIGLDGSIKFETTDIIKPSKLYETIDTMPMRRIELKSNRK
ncbi:DUF4174 domain-containing protein [Winogradskyella sp. PG-2]|uniref:DUF4174 domain-containing protein n=1 Tax=Winogradskyella sp. PG-2 TaxID=754409 RepID=UPI0004586152|nr:DUF4174 domain-containing protein [Winogradskyella sp. PG-2]BAO75995.1 methylmalonyl-CoA epimerase [Winogradskyella sp. PG-2]